MYFVITRLLLFSLFFGIIQSVVKHDIQGGFAIPSYSVALGSVFLGYVVLRGT